jgi:hypothetical protein
MDNLNIGFLASSVLAATGIGVYVYMNNNDTEQLENVNNINNEYSNDDEENESDNMKSNKKSVTVKTKRRNNKLSGTRRKR